MCTPLKTLKIYRNITLFTHNVEMKKYSLVTTSTNFYTNFSNVNKFLIRKKIMIN